MLEVNAKLYDFLNKNETGLYTKEYDTEVYSFVHIDFCDIQEFVDLVGADHFVEGGEEVNLCQSSIVVELNDFIEGDGHYLSSYKSCFSEHDWNHYEQRIKEMEEKT